MTLFDPPDETEPAAARAPTVRVRLVVAYDGSGFHGFAANTGVRTVGGALYRSDDGGMSWRQASRETIDLARHLAAAHELFHSSNAGAATCTHPETNDDFEHLRWFPYPDEARTPTD